MVGLMPDVRGGTPDTTHYRADTSFGSAATGSPGALHGNTACERASRSFERVHDHSDLNTTQLRAKVEMAKDGLNTLRLKNLNFEGSVESTHKRLKEYIDLLQFIGQHSHEIPTLYRLLANAVVNNWSANVILEHCKLAVEGKYTAQNYTLDEIYLAILIYELGTGDWKDCLRTMEIVLEAWKRSVYGEQLHGPILSVASDGDPKRCLALFMMCMHTEIIEGNPLYPFIRELPGLNRRVGKDNLTMDPDFKHEVKRGRTLLCSKAGLLVKNTCINRDLLFSWLERLPDHDWSETSLHALLDPADGQNDDFDPNEAVEFEALCLLAEFLNAWLQPYINTDLFLSEKIESLVLCSHLCAGLYIQNGASLMSNQLFAHVQASVKNAVLMVAKTRVINGELKGFICLLGDDVLEALFGRSRIIGGHSPNCSVAELRDRFMSAMNLDWIYEQYPEFERQPRRLNMSRMRHVGHLRPRHFQRELRAGSCDLPVIWKSAVRKAEAIVAKYGVRMGVSFAIRFKQQETDLLRPFGGKYPALSSKVDRSVVDSSSAPTTDSTVDSGSSIRPT
ncbi:hypothetical protein B0H13DRAFT_2670906 [Mycena leptocephala]|nr:hypothetical protein B0H13DRAFT_2670906 [Mycena leptocephala]